MIRNKLGLNMHVGYLQKSKEGEFICQSKYRIEFICQNKISREIEFGVGNNKDIGETKIDAYVTFPPLRGGEGETKFEHREQKNTLPFRSTITYING